MLPDNTPIEPVTWQSYTDTEHDKTAPAWDGSPDLYQWRNYQTCSTPTVFVIPTQHIDPKYAAKCSKKIRLNAGVTLGVRYWTWNPKDHPEYYDDHVKILPDTLFIGHKA